MKERPILFSTPMVQAIILEGRKTQTRRSMKPQPETYTANEIDMVRWEPKGLYSQAPISEFGCDPLGAVLEKCPYGKPGDVLWIREAWAIIDKCYDHYSGTFDFDIYSGPIAGLPLKKTIASSDVGYYPIYKADVRNHEDIVWRPSIHMPKEACRLRLEITDVRIERLQDISEEDAIAEGVGSGFQMNGGWPDYEHIENGICTLTQDTAVASFNSLWCKINGRKSWNTNPWVWCISFKKL